MKRIIITLSFAIYSLHIVAQYVYTPNGFEVSVSKYTGPDKNSSQITSDSIWAVSYGATVIVPATKTYNCHFYAWAWDPNNRMNMYDPSAYWNDGSYATAYEYDATHIYYLGPSSDHSARRITSSIYESKWGDGPLVQHAPNDVPTEYGQIYKCYVIAQYTVTFDANGGSNAPSSIAGIKAGSPASKISTPSPSPYRSGYVLDGWSTSSSGTPVSFPYWVKSSQTLYAVWSPDPEISGANQLCSGNTQYTLLNPPSGTIYWTSSNTGLLTFSSSSGNPVTATRKGSGTGSVTLSAHTGSVSGTVVASKSVEVCALPPPPPEISGANQLCSGNTQYTLLNPPSGTIYWTSSNTGLLTVTSSGNQTTATRQGSGTGSVTLSARTGSVSGTIVASKSVEVCALPVTPGSINPGSQTIVSGGSVSLTHTGYSNVTSRQWEKSTNDGISWLNTGAAGTSYNTSALSNFGTSNITVIYRVRVNGTNLYSSESVITVTPPPSAPVISGSTLLCYGSSTTFSASNWQSGYYWSASNSLVNISSPSSSSTAISSASSSSQGSVTLSVKDNSGTTLATYSAWVGAPIAYIYPNFTGSTYGFTASPAANSNIYLYSWGASPGEISGNGTSAIYAPYGILGWHDIWVTAYNSCGNCTTYSGFLYEGRGGSTFLMSPNPASTEVEISIYDSSEESRSASYYRYTVTILDNNDTVVLQRNYSGKQFTVPVSSLSNGTYTVELNNGEVTYTQQLTIKH